MEKTKAPTYSRTELIDLMALCEDESDIQVIGQLIKDETHRYNANDLNLITGAYIAMILHITQR